LDNICDAAAVQGGIAFTRDGAAMTLSCDQIIVENSYASELPKAEEDYLFTSTQKITNIISAITAGKNAAAQMDAAIRGADAILSPVAPVKTVNVEMVRQRTGYLKRDLNAVKLSDEAKTRIEGFAPYTRAMTEAEALKEASRCLNCGCGEGCQLCKTICTDFAPEVADTDTMHIRKEECVACGMCFNRCPNGNIEMVNLNYTV
jgi:Pyruvate/2-oxoacid:ferredoxin oxidoreductase delta subunit